MVQSRSNPSGDDWELSLDDERRELLRQARLTVPKLRRECERNLAEADRIRGERARRGRWVGFGVMFRW